MTSLSLGLGGVLAIGASLLSVSFADTIPVAAPPAPADPDCTLTVPDEPLTARGLATPYVLTATDPAKGPCHESNPHQAAFVQATVLDPETGAVFVYNPLVTDRGSEPAVAPVRPKLPEHAVVGIWFGFDGNTLTLGGHAAAGRCAGRSPTQPFGQFASCNAAAFFDAAWSAQSTGRLVVPPLGMARDGRPCPTTRDLGIVGQDHAGNVTTEYLITGRGATAQRTAATTGRLSGSTVVRGAVAPPTGSDNLLLTDFIDPALGCTPWTAPDLADPGGKATSLALNELQVANFKASPVGLAPITGSPTGTPPARGKDRTRQFPADGNPPPADHATTTDLRTYCQALATVDSQRLQRDKEFTAKVASPQPGRTLFDFLNQRLADSFTGLGCQQVLPPAPGPTAGGKPTGMPSATVGGTPPSTPGQLPSSFGTHF
ncbi:hypothetical protein [Kitasatospora sp. NPDC086791]|uniref:hypothetical protein n=1 Tax=Kitasatospora sp. NPDC086791 TaxID=3155178 RepID=UPI00342D406B